MIPGIVVIIGDQRLATFYLKQKYCGRLSCHERYGFALIRFDVF
jgi:hypothetical protein